MLEALGILFEPTALLMMLAAMVWAIILGILPGIGPSLAIALTMPFTFFMKPALGLGTLVAIYNACIYGGSVTAVLINVPGTPGSAATCADGFAMSQKGEAGKALGISIMASAFGGLASAFALLFFAPLIARFALMFGPAEYFWLACWGLTIIAAVTGKKVFLKGLIATAIGFTLAMVGIDSVTGQARYIFGLLDLYDGLDMLALVIGAFAVSQVLAMANEGGSISKVGKVTGKVMQGLWVPFKHWVTLLKSTAIGIIFGAIPAVGMSAASFFSYSEAMRSSKNPEKFGQGAEEGVVAPEAANNATVGGGLIPALTLGIPGTESTAILLGGIFAYGLRPGKDIFVNNPSVFYCIVIALIFSCIMILLMGTLGANLFAKVTLVPGTILIPAITVIYFVGAYATGNRVFSILTAVVVGLMAFLMKRNGYSLISMLLAFVLAPITEDNFVRARMIGGENFFHSFLSNWLSIFLAVLTAASLLWAMTREVLKGRKKLKTATARAR